MQIGLLAPSGFDLDTTASLLQAEGIGVVSQHLGPAGQSDVNLEGIDIATVVVPTPAVVNIGEPVACVRERIGAELTLIVCCPELTNRDRERLQESGHPVIVTPRGWDPPAVAERILAELILAGGIEDCGLGALRGATKVMRNVYGMVRAIADHDDTVLILGETGTGKELIARQTHLDSKRAKKPMKSINCAGLSENLLESELFGYVRGAFTGAVKGRDGYFVAADGGTLFLDEIGDMPLSMQAKLLRALEQHEITPVGSTDAQRVDVRVIAATHVDLVKRLEEGMFREDLYYRLNQWVITAPPLREHRADIPLLVNGILAEFYGEKGRELKPPPGELDALFRYHWPGNVRELYNAVRNVAIAAASSQLDSISFARWQPTGPRPPAARPFCTVDFDPAHDPWDTVHDRVLAKYLGALLRITRGNQAAAAKLAGKAPATISEWRRRLLRDDSASQDRPASR